MEAWLTYLELVLSQGHDKEFKFPQDNYSEGEQGIENAGDLRNLSGALERKCDEEKKKSGKVCRVQKKRIFPTSLFLTQGPLVINVK